MAPANTRTLRILVCPGPLKESLSADDAATAITAGLARALPDALITRLPLSDGGTGFTKRITTAAKGEIRTLTVAGPLGALVQAQYGLFDSTSGRFGVIETATVAGLALVPPEHRNPRYTTTFGLGKLLLHLDHLGCDQILVGCGDTGTNDGGVGLLSALGAKFDTDTDLTHDVLALRNLRSISPPEQLRAKITVACNLTSVLCGEDGTSYIYGPQKGADSKLCRELSIALDSFAHHTKTITGHDVRFIPGGGAGGGIGASLYAYMNATLRFSMSVLTDFIPLPTMIQNHDLIVTAEGRIDSRTVTGKVAGYIALLSKRYSKPTIAFAGSLSDDAWIAYQNGVDIMQPIGNEPATLAESMKNAAGLLEGSAYRTARMIALTGLPCAA